VSVKFSDAGGAYDEDSEEKIEVTDAGGHDSVSRSSVGRDDAGEGDYEVDEVVKVDADSVTSGCTQCDDDKVDVSAGSQVDGRALIGMWSEWQTLVPWASITLGELGTRLKALMLGSPEVLGRLSSILLTTKHRSFAPRGDEAEADLLPLRVALLSAEDVGTLHLERGFGQGKSASARWKPAAGGSKADEDRIATRLSMVHDWVFCCVVVINYTYLGYGKEAFDEKMFSGGFGSAQVECIKRLHVLVDEFIGENVAQTPNRDWATLLSESRVSYEGEVVAKAQELTVEQVLPALPPLGIGGSVDALDLCDASLRPLLEDPMLSIRPRSEWPEKLTKARMKIKPDEWEKLGPILVERGICSTLAESELIVHKGDKLLNGIFGVGKKKWITSPETGQTVEVLRLIVNMVPSNELQVPMTADTGTLPHFGQWKGLELLPDEILIWSSEDINCAFYVFKIPPAWLPWFALGWPISGRKLGLDTDELRYLALRVIPMGWLSAVGICQKLLRTLVMREQPGGAGLPTSAELRKDRRLPVSQNQRVIDFFQAYIDNWDAGSVVKAADGVPKSEWQKAVQGSYRVNGVPRADDKSTHGIEGKTLGADIAGVRGWIGPGEERNLELADGTFYIMRQAPPHRKEISMMTGKWIFGHQFERPLMGGFMNVWDVINGKVAPWLRIAAIAEELMLALGGLPFMGHDLRGRVDSVVTCSDASETGGGVCRSSGISDAGRLRVGTGRQAAIGSRCNGLLVIETFGGISGGRRSLEICGVTPARHLHYEVEETAIRVAECNYPDAIQMGDVHAISADSLKAAVADGPTITHVMHYTGPPCQNVTGLNPAGGGVSGSKSRLVWLLPLIREAIRKAFPKAKKADLCEMVASLVRQDQKVYDKVNGSIPYKLCPSKHNFVRRPRLFWIDWPLPGVVTEDDDDHGRWITVPMRGKRMPLRRWLKRGCRPVSESPTFPTFVRCTIRKKPPFRPAGLSTLKRHELARYKRFQFCYPPYQFQDKHLVRFPNGELKPPDSEMREVLMCYGKDYTHAAFSSTQRRADPAAWERARCSLLGNTFHAGCVAYLSSFRLAAWGLIPEPLSVDYVADPGNFAVASEMDSDLEFELVRYYLTRQGHRGGAVEWLGERCGASVVIPKGIDPREWRWRDTISTAWRLDGEHINVLECRAVVLALRQRFRDPAALGSRFLHLVDSRVCLGMIAKGRTSSLRLRRVLGKVNALLLASQCSMTLGFCRTHLNPSDRPSRRAGRSRATGSSPVAVQAADDGQPDDQ